MNRKKLTSYIVSAYLAICLMLLLVVMSYGTGLAGLGGMIMLIIFVVVSFPVLLMILALLKMGEKGIRKDSYATAEKLFFIRSPYSYKTLARLNSIAFVLFLLHVVPPILFGHGIAVLLSFANVLITVAISLLLGLLSYTLAVVGIKVYKTLNARQTKAPKDKRYIVESFPIVYTMLIFLPYVIVFLRIFIFGGIRF